MLELPLGAVGQRLLAEFVRGVVSVPRAGTRAIDSFEQVPFGGVCKDAAPANATLKAFGPYFMQAAAVRIIASQLSPTAGEFTRDQPPFAESDAMHRPGRVGDRHFAIGVLIHHPEPAEIGGGSQPAGGEGVLDADAVTKVFEQPTCHV